MWVRQPACLQSCLLQQLFLCIYLWKVFLSVKKKKRKKREKKNGKKKRNEEREKKPDARYLRTRIFYIGRDSEEKQILSWTLNLRLFPENVSSCPSDRAVSQGCGGWQKALPKKNPRLQSLMPGDAGAASSSAAPGRVNSSPTHLPTARLGNRPRTFIYCGASRIRLFTFSKMKSSVWALSLAISAKRADSKSRVYMKSLSVEEIHIWKNKLGNRVLFFPPPSLMSGLSNPDRFLQEMGPIYFCAFILLPAACSFEVTMEKWSTWCCVEVCFLYE